jgi:regulatory protein
VRIVFGLFFACSLCIAPVFALSRAPKPDNRELVSASLRLLAMRDMSRAQFVQKLTAKEFSEEDIALAIAWCEAEGWLDERRYAEGLSRKLGARYGAARVAQTMRQKGVGDETVTETVAQMQDSELDRARAIWQRKFGQPGADAAERAKQIRYLQARGFRYETIKKVLAGPRETD